MPKLNVLVGMNELGCLDLMLVGSVCQNVLCWKTCLRKIRPCELLTLVVVSLPLPNPYSLVLGNLGKELM